MTVGKYIGDKIMTLLLNGIGVFLLSLYLLAVGNSMITAALIACVWISVVIIMFYVDYRRRSSYFQKINDLMEHLDQPYLIQEFLGESYRLEDQLYKEILYRSNKAVIEQIYRLEEEQKEYREFLEGWIHEVKLPITGMRLACHNEKNTAGRRMEIYLTEMENTVEQALFYARSEQVYKDFQVGATDIRQAVIKVISKNKYLLIANQMNAQVLFEECIVFADKKWLEFILTQIFINAVKYKKADRGTIEVSAVPAANGTKLCIRDNGIGIPQDEQSRIFEKGFTGSNGRKHEKSTGIGLYLCKKLCRKLEIQISVESIENEYTEIHLIFPKNSYLTKL